MWGRWVGFGGVSVGFREVWSSLGFWIQGFRARASGGRANSWTGAEGLRLGISIM